MSIFVLNSIPLFFDDYNYGWRDSVVLSHMWGPSWGGGAQYRLSI